MSVIPFPTSQASRKRVAQRQQQPTRFWLNRQQQQQGYSEYQQGQAAPAAGNAVDFSPLQQSKS